MTFQPSGSLWQDALVMHNLETGSLWAQVTGECIQGEMEGTTLELYPSSMTTFAEYKRTYPDGMLLSKESKGEAESMYNEYFSDSAKIGIFGRADSFERLKGKDQVFGLRFDKKQVAVSHGYLKEHGNAMIESGQEVVIVSYNDSTGTTAAFVVEQGVMIADGRVSLENGNQVTSWDAGTGASLTPGIADLKPFPVVSAYWFAWVSFFPETELEQ